MYILFQTIQAEGFKQSLTAMFTLRCRKLCSFSDAYLATDIKRALKCNKTIQRKQVDTSKVRNLSLRTKHFITPQPLTAWGIVMAMADGSGRHSHNFVFLIALLLGYKISSNL